MLPRAIENAVAATFGRRAANCLHLT